MKVRGFFDERFRPPAPFIRAFLESSSLGLRRALNFHVDTGASVTTILDKDIRYLRISVENLRRAERDIGGLGGLIDTYVIEDAVLSFRTEDRQIRREKLRLFVGKHDLAKLSPIAREMVLRMPSLLGRDIIQRFRLVCDKRGDEVYLERSAFSLT